MTAYVPGTRETDPQKIIRSLHELASGRSNAIGTVTLTINVSTTTVTDANCASGSVVICEPTTADAATEKGNGTMYVSTISNGSFIITHANSATVGRTFRYAIVG